MVIVGRFKDGVVALEGETHQRGGTTVLQRITWQVESDGVRDWASRPIHRTW
jgi:ABC-type molybdenum transport system ATPase subunit/photorepair protein PhrA